MKNKKGRTVSTKNRTTVTVRLLPNHAAYLDNYLVGRKYMNRQSAFDFLFDQAIARDEEETEAAA